MQLIQFLPGWDLVENLKNETALKYLNKTGSIDFVTNLFIFLTFKDPLNNCQLLDSDHEAFVKSYSKDSFKNANKAANHSLTAKKRNVICNPLLYWLIICYFIWTVVDIFLLLRLFIRSIRTTSPSLTTHHHARRMPNGNTTATIRGSSTTPSIWGSWRMSSACLRWRATA